MIKLTEFEQCVCRTIFEIERIANLPKSKIADELKKMYHSFEEYLKLENFTKDCLNNRENE